MAARLAYRRNSSMFTRLSLLAAWLLASMVWPGFAAAEHGRTHDTVNISMIMAHGRMHDTVNIHMRVVDEAGEPVHKVPISCKDLEQKTMRDGITDAKGEYTLIILRAFQTIECEVENGGSVPEKKKIGLDKDTEVIFTRYSQDSKTIKKLRGWITSRTGGSLPLALVQVVTQNGVLFSRRADGDGMVEFAHLPVGPAFVRYIAAGHEGPDVAEHQDGTKGGPVHPSVGNGKVALAHLQVGLAQGQDITAGHGEPRVSAKDGTEWYPVDLREGSDLSASLQARWDHTGLVLLVPGILCLVLLLGMLVWYNRPNALRTEAPNPRSDPNLWLMLTSLLSWGIMFLWLWFRLDSIGGEDLFFFHPRLAFSLAIPVFGFLGALMWGLDLCRTGKTTSEDFRDFALRLTLGPYAAIVVVLLFKDVFVWFPPDMGASFQVQQATVAFLSGFLVVQVLQSLTEKGSGFCKYKAPVPNTAPLPPTQSS